MTDTKFWSTTSLEPKRNFRFIMHVGPIDEIYVKSADRPTWEISSTPHAYLNHEFKFPGKIKFNDIEVKIVEEVTNGSMKQLLKVLTDSGYSWSETGAIAPPTPGHLNTISKKKAVEALQGPESAGTLLREIDADGVTICEYKLHNAWISKITPAPADYGNEDLTEVGLTITYDYVTVNTNPSSS